MPRRARGAKTRDVPEPLRDPSRIPRIILRVASLFALAFSAATVAEYFLPSATYCEPGGGCDRVRFWAFQQAVGDVPLGLVLPLIGVLGFTALFAGSLLTDRTTSRIISVLAMIGALVAALLLWTQATAIGSWCWLCVGVDSFALVAGIAGAAVFFTVGDAQPRGALRSPWWAAWILAAFAPIAWTSTLPDRGIPPAIRDLYRPGALNVVELADFECPFCRAMNPVLKSVLDDVHERPVNLVRVIVPLPFHVHARDAARAYYCAVRMQHGEEMADALFQAEDLSPEANVRLAESLGMDGRAFEQCLDDTSIERRIRRDERIAERSQNEGLPTVFIGDRVLLGFDVNAGEAPFREAVDAALAGEGTRVRVWPLATVAALAALALVVGRRKKR